MNTRNVAIALIVAVIIVGSGVAAFELHLGNSKGSSPTGSSTLSETGSSLLYPVFNLWAKNYTNATITTASTGSGTGISSAVAGTDIIGASDAYLAPSVANKNPNVMNIPILISYQYITYNIPGLNNNTLNLNATVLTGIYNGTINYWDNAQIKAANPAVASQLPHKQIVPVHRSDGSGDSFMFSSFMSKGNAWWASNVGASTTPSWPTNPASATGAQNSGILATMKSDPYSVGYVAATYASTIHSDGFGIAALQNAAGNYVNATQSNVSQAAAQYLSQIPANGTIALQYAPGATSYPIADMEYVIVKENQTTDATATALKNFLNWVVSPNGGSASKYLSSLNLAPLPANVISKITAPLINNIHGPGGSSTTLVTLSETGSSLLYPAFNLWAPNYTGATITTASTGSGTGISSAIAGTDVIGASDAFLSPSLANKNPGVMNIPILISYQYITYNIPGLNGVTLNLNASMIVGIYNGSIQYWDNSVIASANPGVSLPHKLIVPVHRSDGSGDSFMFTSFLSKANSWWANNVGASTTPSWPTNPQSATGAQNSGVLATMKADPYSIGYVAATYASTISNDGFGIAALQNAAGNYVNATTANVSQAAAQYLNQIPANGTIALQYAPGNMSYPIADMEYVVVQKVQANSATAQALQSFIKWIVSTSGGSAPGYLDQLNLAPLPSAVVNQIVDPLVNKITG